jgi:hypothetical protein
LSVTSREFKAASDPDTKTRFQFGIFILLITVGYGKCVPSTSLSGL